MKVWTEDKTVPASSAKNKNKFSILIPARNEEASILTCLNSLIESVDSYDGEIEIIVIDDHSEDRTFELVNSIQIDYLHILKLEDKVSEKINAYKKAALNLGLSEAKYELIIQLDADVIVPKTYLNTVNNFVDGKRLGVVTAPVLFTPAVGWFENFQCLDMMGMMAVTHAGIRSKQWYMANGANMIYTNKNDVFDNHGLASGDDVYKIQKQADLNKNEVYFLKDAGSVISTGTEKSIGSFYKQRIRWATKNKLMKDKSMLLMMIIPFVNSALIFLSLIFIPFLGMELAILFGFHFLIKLSIDYVFLNHINNFFKVEKVLRYFFISNLVHNLYIVFIGVASLFVSEYDWKGRHVK